ncbi:hypothetical protein ACLB2K_071667 [Fragaria x ananassa]
MKSKSDTRIPQVQGGHHLPCDCIVPTINVTLAADSKSDLPAMISAMEVFTRVDFSSAPLLQCSFFCVYMRDTLPAVRSVLMSCNGSDQIKLINLVLTQPVTSQDPFRRNTILSALGPPALTVLFLGAHRATSQWVTHPGIALGSACLTSEFSSPPKPLSSHKASH